MLKVRTYLKEVQGKGIGLFAGEFIPKGVLVSKFEYPDIVIDETKTHGLTKDFINVYTYEKNGNILLDADNSRFINHSESPNLDYDERMELYANRDILEHEELTCNYFDICDWVKRNGLGFEIK